MENVHDLKWEKGMSVKSLADNIGRVGFQGVELAKASDIIVKMKKNGSKIFFTFTSNMVTSGLRGFFAQLIKLKMADVVVTTIGGLEEDFMKAIGEKFIIGDFNMDDIELYEKGVNRVGNLFIRNENYARFEDMIQPLLQKLYKKKKTWPVSELLREIGLTLKDEDSILYQAAKTMFRYSALQ